LLENVADSVSNGGLEAYASRVESRKVYANELAWLEDCVHRQMFTLSQGKCKCAACVIDELTKKASVVTQRIQEKAKEVRDLAEVINAVSDKRTSSTIAERYAAEQSKSISAALNAAARDFKKGAK